MKNPQPNFERVKIEFYNAFKDSDKATFAILMETVFVSKLLPTWHKRRDQFNKEFNLWLDRIDIRSVNNLIDVMIDRKVGSLPNWIKSRKFVIEYNGNGHLDLIRVERDFTEDDQSLLYSVDNN